jgi:hypothetical protein
MARYNAAQIFPRTPHDRIALAVPGASFHRLSAGLDLRQLGALAGVSIALLLIAGYAVRQQRTPWARYLGHGLFIVLALGLAMHWLPGFYNGRGIAPQRLTDDAVPFSMYLNQDKPLIGFWLLLATIMKKL